MLKELAPITPPIDTFWKTVLQNLCDNSDSIIPVVLQDTATHLNAGEFYVSLAKESGKEYLQIENVTAELGDALTERGWGDGWEILIGGIYRLPISSPLLSG
jgi:hypothetical protein